MTTVPERWSASWVDNLRLAKIADEVDIDYILPIARFVGYGATTNFHGVVLEPIPWASGLLAHTRRIVVFATVPTAFNNPVVSAKQLATVDQVGAGRAGMNIVAGWNEPEYRAMGLELPTNHDDRYAMAQKWWDDVRTLWTVPGQIELPGRYSNLGIVEAEPKPIHGRIPVLNAGSSPHGRAFAARNADFVFTIIGEAAEGAAVVDQLPGPRGRPTVGRWAS